jgi:hypothetical protein
LPLQGLLRQRYIRVIGRAFDNVRAAGVEIFGDSPQPPPHAIVHFRGTDPHVGRLTKYTVVEPDVHAR